MALIIAETNRMNRGRLIELFEMITDNWRADAYEKLDYTMLMEKGCWMLNRYYKFDWL